MRLASRELRVRVPVETKSLSEKGGDVELHECGEQGGAMGEEKLVQVQEEDSTIGHI